MYSARSPAALAALASLLLLPACGGGDGDVGGIAPMPESPPPSTAGALSGDPGGQRDEAAMAATALPNFGSVTQSSNVTLDGQVRVTEDSASASFDGHDILVTVGRPGRSSLILDSAAEESGPPDIAPAAGGYAQRFDVLVDPPDEDDAANPGIAVAYVQTRWKDGDPADFLAWGFWASLEFDPDAEELSGLALAGIGTFVDGPELRGMPTLPSGGTATYEGGASGLYAYVQGDGPAGSGEAGLFSAMARLTADFGAGTVAGCIGCTGGIMVLADDAASEDEVAIEPETIPANIVLSPAPIGSDGTFLDDGVAVEIAGRDIADSSGAWGGRFSTVADAAGDPRLAAGTAGAEWTEADGSQGVFLGSWFADKQ
ncbi:MAG: hypothetical protein OXI22_08140 [Defluviicoccus sp.]|nr:hypothetical protein [Defluviicoccus sp.]MDE0383836.1 hypothetical protein [Defluviicoccus sp.]